MTLLAPEWLVGLAALPVVAVLMAVSAARRRAALARFFGPMAARLGLKGRPTLAGWAASAAALAGLGLVAVALARPVYDPKPQKVRRAGRDVVFVIDVSRSMLAQDIRPNRLERAKLAVRDVLDVVEGDRVGIIAFAGAALVKCPLTTDYAFARMILDELSPDSVARGGTAIGDALRSATELLTAGEESEAARDGRYRDVFLFTDGEDHESDPVKAAGAAGEQGIRIIAIGLGSDTVGAPVPKPAASTGARGGSAPSEAGGFLEYGGERVRSLLDPESLRRIAAAAAPGSQFLNVGTGNVELDRVYKRLMKSADRRELEATETVRYTEAFQFALGAALLLLCIDPLIGLARRRS